MLKYFFTFVLVGFIALSCISSVSAFGNDINPPPSIDINDIDWGDANVSGWAQTSTIQSVTISGDSISFPHSKAGQWPIGDPFGDGTAVEGNVWIFVHLNGQWKAATFDWLRPGQTTKDTSNILCGGGDETLHGMSGFSPVSGDIYGFMVSGMARNNVTPNIQERSNIVTKAWTGTTDTSICGGGGGGGTIPSQPTAPPIITGFNFTSIVPGQSVEVYGTNLSNEIELVSGGGTSINVVSSVNNQLNISTFEIPFDIAPGTYKITVTNSKGSVTSTQSLTIKVGGESFIQQEAITPPTQGLPTDLGQLIQQIFAWSLAVLGIAVFVMFFYAGFLWLTAAGNTARVGEAKSRMTNAVLGAILLLSSYLILNTINPDFVENTFNLPGLGETTTETGGNGGGGGGGGGGGHCSGAANNSADYGGAVGSAMNAIIGRNPNGIADKVNIEINQLEFLNYVADELRTNGHEATVHVLNGNSNPNRGDLIAIWESGDSLMERYDVIISGGAGDQLLRNATAVQYTGDIPLDCIY